MKRVAICIALALVVASASGAAAASTYWATGVKVVLPANAATGTDQVVSLSSVSCASAGNCSAVGSYRNKAGRPEGLLVTEKGGRWAPGIEAVLPANGVTQQDVYLNSVSCASAGNCTAVGSYYDTRGSEGLLLTETAGTWAPGVEAALPATATATDQYASLASVSCASAGNCSAVGGYHDSSGAGALLLTESAGTWQTGVEATLPANASTTAPSAGLTSVSCSSAGNCTAVGSYLDSSGNGPGLLLTETSGTWGTGVEATLPANAAATQQFVGLSSVSCSSAGNCGAVGSYNTSVSNDAVLLRETGGSWSAGVKATLPANGAPQDQIDLNAISCPSATSCTAVGDYVDRGGNIRGLMLSRSAGGWSKAVEAALPADADTTSPNQLGGLKSVSCASAGNCSAVGTYRDKKHTPQDLVLTETAGSWAAGVEATVGQKASYGAGLTSVSCPTAQRCGAVGGFEQGRGDLFNSSATRPCLVPKLRGKTLPAAKRSIKTAGCSVGTIQHAGSSKIERGRVISQTPKPGTRLKHGAKVDLVVSRG
jgi:PASTA domain